MFLSDFQKMGNLLQLISCGYKLGKEKQIFSGNGSENPGSGNSGYEENIWFGLCTR